MRIEIGEDDSIGVEDPSRSISEQRSNSQDIQSEIALQKINNTTTDPTITTEHVIDIVDDLSMLQGKSFAHHYFDQDQAVLCSFDIKTGGEFCGILQISAQILCVTCLNSKNLSTSLGPIFNE